MILKNVCKIFCFCSFFLISHISEAQIDDSYIIRRPSFKEIKANKGDTINLRFIVKPINGYKLDDKARDKAKIKNLEMVGWKLIETSNRERGGDLSFDIRVKQIFENTIKCKLKGTLRFYIESVDLNNHSNHIVEEEISLKLP